MNRPPISERPPSGYSVSQDATLYKNLSVVGWVRWEPGQKYSIRISVKAEESDSLPQRMMYAQAQPKQ